MDNIKLSNVKVVSIKNDIITFDNGAMLYSEHEQSCCESHYLSMKDLVLADFEGLEFNISNDKFFERIKGYGIALIPLNGHPVRIPGYGYNNGFYSSNLALVLEFSNGSRREYDVTYCQDISDG